MLLGNVIVRVGKNVDTVNKGRFFSKNISRFLTETLSKDMMAFYPSVVNCNSLEIICEAIGNQIHMRNGSNRFDFNKVNEKIESLLREEFNSEEFEVVSTFTYEIAYTRSSFAMIYCYKQDDYLIPDSDPHDVMASENIYNTATSCYSGRFLPMIKLICDITQNTNMVFVGDMVKSEKYPMTIRQEFEYKTFSANMVKKEIRSIKKTNVNEFKYFNKYYKILVSDRTMILPTISGIVSNLYDKNQLCSRAVYTIDVIDSFECCSKDTNFFLKTRKILQELKGSTLVVFVDVPNHFIVTKEKYSVETDAYQKELMDNDYDDKTPKVDQDFNKKMNDYNLLDIDDALDFDIKTSIVRKITTTIDKNADKEDQNFEAIEEVNRLVRDCIRNMNVIFAYTDILAFNQNFLFEKFEEMANKQSIEMVTLSDSAFTNDKMRTFGQSIALNHFSITKGIENKELLDYIGECVDVIVSECTNNDPEKNYAYTSLYGYRYLVHNSFSYRFTTDIDGNEYFKEFKKRKTEVLNNLEGKTEEEKEEIRKKFGEDSAYGVTDDDTTLNSSDDHEFDFFSDRNYKKNQYNFNKSSDVKLEDMVGLTKIKEQIKDFTAFVQLNKIKESKNLKPIPISKHMVFMGNPGTAKTSVALQLAKILHNAGLIPTSDVKHVSRDDLVGKYVGWTARLVKEAIEGAKGGILFVDEAYSLVAGEGGTNSYGMEAVNTFVNYMDKADIRDSTIIIFAGYKDEMKEFIDSNPGLKSRIGFYFDFPDYTTDELIEIAKIQAKNAEYVLEDGYIDKLRNEIDKCRDAKDFGNGRFVRNIFEKSVLQQSRRLQSKGEKHVQNGNFTKKELTTICSEDFSTKGINVSSSKKNVGFMSKVQEEKFKLE